MAKTKRMVSYRDSRVIKNGTTTIVFGEIQMKVKGQLREDLYKLDSNTSKLLGRGHGETKGVSKLFPGDTYDELTGRIVASKKAEMQGLKASRKLVADYVDSLEKVLTGMKAQLELIDARYTALENDKH